MSSIASVASAAAELAATFAGQLLKPADVGYEDARKVHNGLVDKRPALIARCRGVADVVDAVDLTRRLGLEVAVRGGGHNVAGRATIDGGVMIDLAPMKGIHVDPKSRTVRAQGGVTWGELNRETQLHGLAVTGGVVSSTGIAGLTLGGGLGWLMGKHGLALDNLGPSSSSPPTARSCGPARTRSPTCSGPFAAAAETSASPPASNIELHPVGPTVTGGPIVHPIDRARDVLKFYRDSTAIAARRAYAVRDTDACTRRLRHEGGRAGHVSLRPAGGRRKSHAAAEAVRVARLGCSRADALLPAQHACSMPTTRKAPSTTGSRTSSRS